MAVRLKDLTPAQIRALVNRIAFELDTDELRADITDAYLAAIQDSGQLGMRLAGSADPFAVRDKVTERYLVEHAGAKWAKQINDYTRGLLRGVFNRALKEETGLAGIVEGLKTTFADMEGWRAETIARTETALALNHGATEGYRQAGVQAVMVIDGEDWDEECRTVDGMQISVELAAKHPIGHVNCTRSFQPIPGEFPTDELDDEDFLAVIGKR